ncbi:hypothetical protein HOP50_05g38530 [Chloropicon primus]|uniref:Uncharacterized protein n=1 Tax=Chloropicon primus TaxID=1764295 RepID=A0A5B8MPW1_9CHLO|nr:hypothetical protein A3770_05p38400 [Chloropicon primus]UPR00538.1 hypothetical protein HOP50_05g38530 [Chloropicon primus]|mmetsp:Transcript_6764/g.19775  ORF Transcript_6764/g.19775 Transcript_6764/m.19775 type:complete len:105 (+) Transcript_6764:234-548(+)|eukprot:QDZ21322.1 hypothetical protein A3770_05p38400 [Chloropicon primus]
MRTRASLRKKGDELGAGASGDGVSDPELKELKKRKQRDRDQVLSVTETMKSWVDDTIFKYNITFGLYMLDPWERCVFNLVAFLVFLFIIFSIYRQVVYISYLLS